MSMRQQSRNKEEKKSCVGNGKWIRPGEHNVELEASENLVIVDTFIDFFVVSIITWIQENSPKIFANDLNRDEVKRLNQANLEVIQNTKKKL